MFFFLLFSGFIHQHHLFTHAKKYREKTENDDQLSPTAKIKFKVVKAAHVSVLFNFSLKVLPVENYFLHEIHCRRDFKRSPLHRFVEENVISTAVPLLEFILFAANAAEILKQIFRV
jgi:hypothetical protein